MLKTDEDAVVCDLAETYHILFYKQYPASLVATLASGLGMESRIKSKLSGSELPYSILLEAAIFDDLQWLVWSKTKDAEKGRNRPKSLVDRLKAQDKNDSVKVFRTPEDFQREWSK